MAGRRMRKPWAKLDFDWFEDPQVMLLESQGARDALDYAKLIALWSDFADARIDLNDMGHLLKLRTKLRRSDKSLRCWLEKLSSLGLIEPELWAMGVVTSRRAADDACARQCQRDGGARGGEASSKG